MSEADLPLSGIRVLDIATYIAAPSCAALLAEFGADVIKIENPAGGDPLRQLGTPRAADASSLLWLNEGRNKRSVTLNLKHKRGAALFLRLAKRADVVCENFRPGTLERWGVGYAAMSAQNAGLVLLRVSGFGQGGPYRDRPGFARIAHAVGGLSHLTGMHDGPPLTPGSTSLADYMSGLYRAIGILVALRQREKTGTGQVVDVALYESVFRALDEIAPARALTGKVRGRQGIGTVNACPHGHFATSDGKWVAIACTNDRMFKRLAEVMEAPELAAPDRFGKLDARLESQVEVDALVQTWTASRERDEILSACERGDVPCGPVMDIADILADKHFAARGTLQDMMVPGVGPLPFPAPLPRLSDTPGKLRHVGPKLGDANEEVFLDELGLSSAEFESLKRAGTI